ncbi:MAG: SH3 domain-containing protein [Traorella sp.]
MIKRILLILLIICLCGCESKAVYRKEITSYENERETMNEIETILSYEQIQAYNQTIKKKTSSLYDLNAIQSMSKEDIYNMIQKYPLPELPKYDGKRLINQEEINQINENRNLSNIQDIEKIQYGIVVHKTDLKSNPSTIKFYQSADSGFDRIQESELHVNTALIILHESLDKEWYFVISEIYAGWVLKKDIALASSSDIEYFDNHDFILVIDAFVFIEDSVLEMGVKLPYLGEKGSCYLVALPFKKEDDSLGIKEIFLDSNSCSKGYLPYNKQNVLNQAQKYLGTSYSWGGQGIGIDCSGFVSNVYRTFGFIFPRNTDDQEEVFDFVVDVSGQENAEKLIQIENHQPSLLYQDGHVMMYFRMNDRNYIIHASGYWMKVVCEELTLSHPNLSNIRTLICLH